MYKNRLIALAASTALMGFLAFGTPADDKAASAPATHRAETPEYPKGYFQSPVSTNILLTGTFGELRPDHFHAGIDIKSKNGGVGQPIFAAAEGFVDRIKVQASGYGNVLYLKHPNGYGTVYAHLDRFSPELEKFVRDAQYKQERFEVDLQPADGQFRVRKGQEIGKMGNSGSSSGPHLHFEIRHSASGKVLNPQLFDLPIPDQVPPDLRDMKVYFLNEQREVVQSKPLPLRRDKSGRIGLQGDTLRFGAWRVGFGVKAYDHMSGFRNDNGVYSISLYADDQLAYQWRMDALDFDDTRYHNAHVDYPARRRYGAWFHRCFVLPGNRLNNYARTESMGAIALYREKPVKINLKVADADGNTSSLQFWALRDDPVEAPPPTAFQYELSYAEEFRLNLEDFGMALPKGALYESLRLQYATSPSDEAGQYSSIHHVHDDRTPVHKYFDLSLRPFGLPEALRSKAVIAECGDGRPVNCGGSWQGDKLSTRIRGFGNYCVMADAEAPTITPIVFDDDMRRKNTMSFRIRDNFATGGQANGLRYRGTVDGQWVLFEYDRKRDRLTHTFDGRIGTGKHRLRLEVRDDRGNESFFEGDFLR
jgi:murein DD-endopeptidase MepM/ murein hydrolase activator NlpD